MTSEAVGTRSAALSADDGTGAGTPDSGGATGGLVPQNRKKRPPVVSQLLLTLALLVFLAPLAWMVLSSLKSAGEIFTTPPKLFGESLLFSNYSDALDFLPFGRFMINTAFVAVTVKL